jgi:glycosyltransferase involved in cell wall biosynthesis
VVTTLHTLLQEPNGDQRAVMDDLVRRSDRLVVMARKGAEILRDTYGVPYSKVDIIPHGIPDVPFEASSLHKARFGLEGRTVLLTFGLLGPGKGLESAIDALPGIVAGHPDVLYVILGATHPHIVARDGEAYRRGLERRVAERGMEAHVRFVDEFVSAADLRAYIGATDVYLTPYPNVAQITSGTLVNVFGAGRAVVSTPYWHAQELLADGRGLLVPFRDPAGMAQGVCRFLDDPELLRSTRANAYRVGRRMIWPAVASLYLDAFERAGRARNASRAAARRVAPPAEQAPFLADRRRNAGSWLSPAAPFQGAERLAPE